MCLLLFVNIMQSQYISEILEYKPAPGQLINTSPWGMPESANSIVGTVTGKLNLGAFGGYVVFKFENPVQNNPNNPYGIDFTIFGNPLADWAEPAVVYVMQDANNNGVADDIWYELAGSDYFFSSSNHNYEITYENPGGEQAQNVYWTDNQGNSGYIATNSYHNQNYYPSADYFTDIPQANYTLSGSYIAGAVNTSNSAQVKSYKRDFGYADNQFRGVAPFTLPDNPYTEEVENSGGDAFDISWAVDANGNYIDLTQIDFIKVQSAMLENAGWLGEISTEITGAAVVENNGEISDNFTTLTIKDIPKTIINSELQLEVFVFENGKRQPDKNVSWETNNQNFYVDENNILHLDAEGNLELTAVLDENPNIRKTIYSTVDFSVNTNEISESEIKIYPNPASDYFYVNIIKKYNIQIFDLTGNLIFTKNNCNKNSAININSLNKGIYVVRIESEGYIFNKKLVILQ